MRGDVAGRATKTVFSLIKTQFFLRRGLVFVWAVSYVHNDRRRVLPDFISCSATRPCRFDARSDRRTAILRNKFQVRTVCRAWLLLPLGSDRYYHCRCFDFRCRCRWKVHCRSPIELRSKSSIWYKSLFLKNNQSQWAGKIANFQNAPARGRFYNEIPELFRHHVLIYLKSLNQKKTPKIDSYIPNRNSWSKLKHYH